MSNRSTNLHLEKSDLSLKERQIRMGGPALTVWFTGLSGSGKSSLSRALERRLFDLGKIVYRLDGDNIRHGLNKDLSFSAEDRSENIRRVAEVARLFNDAGVTVICSFISPIAQDRENARKTIGENSYYEVYLSTDISVCESRDPHGLYKLARAGKITNFTGIGSTYDVPQNSNLVLDTSKISLEQCTQQCLHGIEQFLKT